MFKLCVFFLFDVFIFFLIIIYIFRPFSVFRSQLRLRNILNLVKFNYQNPFGKSL